MAYPAGIIKGVPRVCDTLHCKSMKAEYHITRLDAPFHVVAYLCPDCAKSLAQNLPAELTEGGDDLEQKLRKKITKEYDAKLAEIEAAYKKNIAIEVQNALKVQALGLELKPKAILKVEEVTVKEAEKEEVDYRCLDCGESFDTKRKLTEHKKSAHA